MGADNWAVCPRCLKNAENAKRALEAMAQAVYGKVTPDEYEELRVAAAAPIDVEKLSTFREDYELGMVDDGTFEVIYSGSCSPRHPLKGCGYEHKFRHIEEVPV
jgi:hypothetical protein